MTALNCLSVNVLGFELAALVFTADMNVKSNVIIILFIYSMNFSLFYIFLLLYKIKNNTK